MPVQTADPVPASSIYRRQAIFKVKTAWLVRLRMLCGLHRLPSFPGTASSSGCRLVACSTWSAPSTPSGDVALDLDCPRPAERQQVGRDRQVDRVEGWRQSCSYLQTLVEGSVPNVAASGAATGIETGQQLRFSHGGVGRSKPTNATPSAATAFSACRPEDAKSYPNKMFELSGFRDATTAGNWRHRNLREPSASGARLSEWARPEGRAAAGDAMRGRSSTGRYHPGARGRPASRRS